jgi:hypothetical protein
MSSTYRPEIGQLMIDTSFQNYSVEELEYVKGKLYKISERLHELDKESALSAGVGYGIDFENNVFEMHPYYWGECECNYDAAEEKWSKENEHHPQCYQILLESRFKAANPEGSLLVPIDETEKQLCSEMGLSYPEGSAVHCTCDFRDRWNAFLEENDHDASCRITKPNFRHKKLDFEVNWYKYIGRGMSMNKPLDKKALRGIFRECFKSIEG